MRTNVGRVLPGLTLFPTGSGVKNSFPRIDACRYLIPQPTEVYYSGDYD